MHGNIFICQKNFVCDFWWKSIWDREFPLYNVLFQFHDIFFILFEFLLLISGPFFSGCDRHLIGLTENDSMIKSWRTSLVPWCTFHFLFDDPNVLLVVSSCLHKFVWVPEGGASVHFLQKSLSTLSFSPCRLFYAM